MEASHDWGGAIHEYQLAGERPPGSRHIARAYDEWGEQLSQELSYAAAFNKFEVVVAAYSDATVEFQRAESDLIQLYPAWVATNAPGLPYDTIVHDVTDYRASAACDTSCQATTGDLEAHVYYLYGQQLATKNLYYAAIMQFEALIAQFPHSPYAKQAHAAAASAYYAMGKVQLADSNCAIALTTLQRLISKYGDTPEAAQARGDLAAPVDVTGTLTDYPPNAGVTMYLSRHVDPAAGIWSDDYSSGLDSSGQFAFTQVKPGNYNLSAVPRTGSGWYWLSSSNSPYSIVVSPLCTVNTGMFRYG